MEAMRLLKACRLLHRERLRKAVRSQFLVSLRRCLAPVVQRPKSLVRTLAMLNLQYGRTVATISGSMVLQATLGELFDNANVDLYCTHEVRDLLAHHLDVVQGMTFISRKSGLPEYPGAANSYAIDKFQRGQSEKIQIIIVGFHVHDPRLVVTMFDFAVVKNYYDGMHLGISYPQAISSGFVFCKQGTRCMAKTKRGRRRRSVAVPFTKGCCRHAIWWTKLPSMAYMRKACFLLRTCMDAMM